MEPVRDWEQLQPLLSNPTINLLSDDENDREDFPASMENLLGLLQGNKQQDVDPQENEVYPSLDSVPSRKAETIQQMNQPYQRKSINSTGAKKRFDIQISRLVQVMSHPTKGVPLRTRNYYLKTYENCFVAFEFVQWLVHHRIVANRKHATKVGNDLMERGLIRHVAGDITCFKDDYFFFVWNSDHPLIKSLQQKFSPEEESNWLDALLQANKGEDFEVPSWVSLVPVNLFTAPMGTAALGLLWKKLTVIWNIPPYIPICPILLSFALLLFVLILGLYLFKTIRYPQSTLAEWRHNTLSNLFSSISITLLLFAASGADQPQEWLKQSSFAVWVIGTLLSSFFAIECAAQWAIRGRTLSQFNPTYFLPVVTLVLVPMAGVHYNLSRLSWAFWGIGSFYWLILFSLFYLRIIFVGMIPPHLVPCLYIGMAPPAIIANSFFVLTHNEYPAVAASLWGVNIFMFVLMTRLRMTQRSVPFSLSSWAYTFPIAASALASAQFHLQLPGTMEEMIVSQVINVIMSAAATFAWVFVLAATVVYLMNWRIFLPVNRFHSTEECD